MLKVKDGIIGHAIGDAMGVPIEFRDRQDLLKNPVTNMIGHGTYSVPEGTWSDDTSMEIALMDSFIKKKSFFLISSDEDITWQNIIFEWLLMVVSAPIYLYLGEIYSKIFLCSILGFVSVQMAVMMIDEEIKSEKVDVFDIIGIIFCCSVPVLLILCLMLFSW